MNWKVIKAKEYKYVALRQDGKHVVSNVKFDSEEAYTRIKFILDDGSVLFGDTGKPLCPRRSTPSNLVQMG